MRKLIRFQSGNTAVVDNNTEIEMVGDPIIEETELKLIPDRDFAELITGRKSSKTISKVLTKLKKDNTMKEKGAK